MISVVLFSAAIVAVDPQYADNITVYHVNPHQYGAIPVNMVCLSKWRSPNPRPRLFVDE